MIKADEISFSYGAGLVFDKASFVVGNNQKVGLVGVNGSGKSTLFKIITNEEQASGGIIKIVGKIGFVPQEVKRDKKLEDAKSVREYVDPTHSVQDFDLKKLLYGIELVNLNLDSIPRKMSGGQKTKLALAKALVEEPDILILDEPTNFMDVNGKKFVSEFLNNYPKTLLIVSHDLELLNSSINKVLEVNTQTRKIDEYKGNYSDYLKLKKERERILKREYEAKKQHIKKMETALVGLYRLKSDKGVRQRVQHQKKLEREKVALPTLPEEMKKFKLRIPDPPRVSELPIKIINVSKSYDDKVVLKNFSLSVIRGEKLAVVGKNGSGKSTLIKIMMNMIDVDSGVVERSDDLKIGYYSQEFESFDLESNVLDLVIKVGEIDEGRARSFLASFMFVDTKVKQKIGSLSGGEKTRLSIALLMLKNNNVLVLDEPTTYLDPMSQRIVLEALKSYKGTLVLVSHSVDFVREIVPTRALLMPENKILLWEDKYLNKIEEIE